MWYKVRRFEVLKDWFPEIRVNTRTLPERVTFIRSGVLVTPVDTLVPHL